MSTPRKSGSAMSDRQMARAAVEGRQIEFINRFDDHRRFDGYGPGSLAGFLVGMDDFHWMIVRPSTLHPGTPAEVILVHKSCPFVKITSLMLSSYSDEAQQEAAAVGQAFWNYCKTTYLGHAAATEETK